MIGKVIKRVAASKILWGCSTNVNLKLGKEAARSAVESLTCRRSQANHGVACRGEGSGPKPCRVNGSIEGGVLTVAPPS